MNGQRDISQPTALRVENPVGGVVAPAPEVHEGPVSPAYRELATTRAVAPEVSDPGEPAEREAEVVARAVTDGVRPSPLPPTPDGQGDGPLPVQRHAGPRARSATHRDPTPSVPTGSDPTPPGPGEPLQAATREWAEGRFATSLPDVRIHTGDEAAHATARLSAHAFTVGRHVTFAPGRYSPGSAAGQRLLAHELTHVLQGSRRVLRQHAGDQQPRSPAADTALPDAAEQRKQAHSTAVMMRAGPLSGAELSRVDVAVAGVRLVARIDRRNWLAQQRDRQQSRGMGIAFHAGPQSQAAEYEGLQQEIATSLQALGLASEAALHTFLADVFPNQVLAKAKQIALAMLDENEAVARREQVRYGRLVCNRDQAGLLAADRQLSRLDRRGEITRLRADFERDATPLQRRGMGIAALTRPSWQALSAAEASQHRADELRGVLGMQYPILLAESYRPGMFADADPMTLHEVIQGPSREVLENIAHVREAIGEDDLKVWQIPNAVAMAKLALGIAGERALVAAVDAKIASVQRDERFWGWVKAALAIGTTLLAGFFLTPAAGALVGAAWGIDSLIGNIKTYRLERAAGGTSLDPAVADMSVNEPELLWIVLDIVGLGLDLAVVTKAVRVAARGVMRNPGPTTLARLETAATEAGVPAQARGGLRGSVARRFGLAVDDVVDITPQTRRVQVSDPALLAEYERLGNLRMRASLAHLMQQGATATRRELAVLEGQFRALMTQVGDAPLTAVQRADGMRILERARALTDADWGNVRGAIRTQLRNDPQLAAIAQRMVAAGDAQLGRAGQLRVRTVHADGRVTFQALEPDHLVRRSDNPWRYSDPTNLNLTDSAQNQQFLETMRRQGSIWASDDVERFVVGNGLVNQSTIHLPGH